MHWSVLPPADGQGYAVGSRPWRQRHRLQGRSPPPGPAEPPLSRTHGPARSASRRRPPRTGGRRRQRPPSVWAVTDGPDLAERQLRELVAASGGSLEVLDTRNTEGGRWFTISMYTSGIPAGAGIRVRDRERFQVFAGMKYPHRHPAVRVPHRRWARSAHVQWGCYLCCPRRRQRLVPVAGYSVEPPADNRDDV